jgi:hypothetical protein
MHKIDLLHGPSSCQHGLADFPPDFEALDALADETDLADPAHRVLVRLLEQQSEH